MLRAIVGIYPMHTASDSSREPCCKSVFVDKHIYLCALYDVHVQCVHTDAMKPWEIIKSHNASSCENSVCFLPLPRLVVLWLQFLRKRELNFGIRFDLILTWEKKKKNRNVYANSVCVWIESTSESRAYAGQLHKTRIGCSVRIFNFSHRIYRFFVRFYLNLIKIHVFGIFLPTRNLDFAKGEQLEEPFVKVNHVS